MNRDVQISPQVWEIFSHCFFQKAFCPFILSSSGTPIMSKLFHWMESHKSHGFASLFSILSSREAGCSLTCSHFPCRRNHGLRRSAGPELCQLGRGVIWAKWNSSSYPLQCIQCQNFLLQQCAETLLDSLTSTEAGLIHGWFSKSVFLGGKVVENSYSTVLMYQSPWSVSNPAVVTWISSVCGNTSSVHLWFMHFSSLLTFK